MQVKTIILLLAFLLTGSIISKSQNQNPKEREQAAKLQQLMDSYQYEQACLVADQLLSSDSLNASVLTIKGRALAALFKTQQAIRVFLNVLVLDTTNAAILYELVNSYRQAGDLKQAINFCKKIVALYPEQHFFSIQLANLYYGLDEFRMAKMILRPLFLRDTLNTYVLKQLANSHNELQEADSAISYYWRYLDIVPSDAVITSKLANLFIRKRDYPAATVLTESFLAYDSTNTGILKLNAYCYYLMKDFVQANRKFARCYELGDKSRFTLKYYGLSFYKQEMYDLAEPIFRQAFQADTTDSEVCFYYGVSAYRSSLPDTGVVYLERTYKMLMPDPMFINTLYMELAGAYTANRNIDTALFLLKKAYAEYPENFTLAFKIAYQYDFFLRKPFLALPYYNEFLKKCPESEKIIDSVEHRKSYFSYAVNRVKQIKGK